MNRESEIQRRFGAKISLKSPAITDRQLFLILGGGPNLLAGRIAGLDGKVALAGPNWVLAEMGFSQAMSLRGSPGVRVVAGVNVDAERLGKIRDMLKTS
jgi:hypothetical protein